MTGAGDRDGYFRVVVNDASQYGVWPLHTRIAAGWRPTAFIGSRQRCLDHIAALWPDAAPRYPVAVSTPTLVDLCHQTARRQPQACAVRDEVYSLTYVDLMEQSGWLAAALLRRGARPGHVIATDLPPGPNAVVAMLGVLRAGAAYLPLDPAWPQRFRERALAEAIPRFIVTMKDLAWPQSAEATLPLTGGTDAACVLHTPGRTPAPVVLEHRHVAAFAVDDNVLPASASASASEIIYTGPSWSGEVWRHLAMGTPLVVGRHDQPRPLHRAWGDGMLETAWAHSVLRRSDGRVVGMAKSGTWLHVLDPQLRLVPDGAVGWLYVGGAGVARGYLSHPALTAGRFLPDPFAGAGARMFATGKRVRRRGQTIEYLSD